jgi:hypothetical protein
MGDGSRLDLAANLSDRVVQIADRNGGTVIWGHALSGDLPSWTLGWRIR